MKKILFPLILMVVILSPLAASAAIPDCNKSLFCLPCFEGSCGVCDIVDLIMKMVHVFLVLAGSISLFVFVLAGFKMVYSGGEQAKVKSAKDMLVGALTGIVIVFSAWAIVGFILDSATNKKIGNFLGHPWYQIDCVREPATTYVAGPKLSTQQQDGQQYNGGGDDGGCKSSWETSYGTGGSCNGDPNCVGFTTEGIKREQCKDASANLVSLFTCMDNGLRNNPNLHLIKSDIIITSISDDAGLLRCRTNFANPPCAHGGATVTYGQSCHYGLGQTNGSYAMDIRSTNLDSTKATELKQLIIGCGGKYFDETNTDKPHHHFSSSGCSGI
jgi:hypothetical protein